MVDVDRALKNTVKNGKVLFGAKQTQHAIDKGSAKMIIMASNCPFQPEITKKASTKKIPVYNYRAKSIDMGYACGKTFPVSVLAVLEEGGSNILQLAKKR